MRIEQLRKAVFREPFRPVVITLRSGERFVVRDPESVLVHATMCVALHGDRDFTLFGSRQVASVRAARRVR